MQLCWIDEIYIENMIYIEKMRPYLNKNKGFADAVSQKFSLNPLLSVASSIINNDW